MNPAPVWPNNYFYVGFTASFSGLAIAQLVVGSRTTSFSGRSAISLTVEFSSYLPLIYSRLFELSLLPRTQRWQRTT